VLRTHARCELHQCTCTDEMTAATLDSMCCRRSSASIGNATTLHYTLLQYVCLCLHNSFNTVYCCQLPSLAACCSCCINLQSVSKPAVRTNHTVLASNTGLCQYSILLYNVKFNRLNMQYLPFLSYSSKKEHSSIFPDPPAGASPAPPSTSSSSAGSSGLFLHYSSTQCNEAMCNVSVRKQLA
jgi:hypothetical protein